MEEAQWNYDKRVIDEAQPKKLYDFMPVIELLPSEKSGGGGCGQLKKQQATTIDRIIKKSETMNVQPTRRRKGREFSLPLAIPLTSF